MSKHHIIETHFHLSLHRKGALNAYNKAHRIKNFAIELMDKHNYAEREAIIEAEKRDIPVKDIPIEATVIEIRYLAALLSFNYCQQRSK